MSFWTELLGFLRPAIKEKGQKEGVNASDVAAQQPPGTAKVAVTSDASHESVEVLQLEIFLQTDPGSVRTNNEDRCFYKRPGDPTLAASKGTLVIVADGMGGAAGGEVASEMAIRTIPDLYYNSTKAPALAVKESLETASSEIYRAAQADPELRGMGTTCVAVAILIPQVFVAYVGDSRLYLLREGGFYQITEDHTIVGDMVRKGILTREQARTHEERNVLSLSLGGRPEIQASYLEEPMTLLPGDRLLLCSDGLHDLISDLEMQSIVAASPVQDAVQGLINAANREGGHDNITAALIHAYIGKPSERDCRATRELSISSA